MNVKYDHAGKRFRECRDALSIMQLEEAWDDWPIKGPRTVRWCLEHMITYAGTPKGWHQSRYDTPFCAISVFSVALLFLRFPCNVRVPVTHLSLLKRVAGYLAALSSAGKHRVYLEKERKKVKLDVNRKG